MGFSTPSAFVLGVDFKFRGSQSIQDLNNLNEVGYYYNNGGTNSPFSGWKCVIVFYTNALSQIAISLANATVGSMAVRAQVAGTTTWGSWKEVSFTQ